MIINYKGDFELKRKIAVITTDFLREFFISALSKLNMDFEFLIYIYHSFDEIAEVYKKIPNEIDGILTSGSFPAEALKKSWPNINVPVVSINIDEASIYRSIFALMMDNENFQLSRIYVDPLEFFNIDVKEYIQKDPMSNYSSLIEPVIKNMELSTLRNIEEEQIQKHISLWESGEIDVSITRFSSIVSRLREAGVNVFFPYPSLEYIKTMVGTLLKEIEVMKLRKHQPAAINVSINKKVNEGMIMDSLLERQYLMLNEALINFNGESVMDYVLKRHSFGFEILTERARVESFTSQYTGCRLKKYLAVNLPFTVSVGYGIGKDMYQARMNAVYANREASIHKENLSFIIDEKECLIGPLNGENILIHSEAESIAFNEISEDFTKIGLSPLTTKKVIYAINSMPNKKITAKELAGKLSVSQRTANRFLTELEKSNVIKVVDKKRPTTKGRPERVYAINECSNL